MGVFTSPPGRVIARLAGRSPVAEERTVSLSSWSVDHHDLPPSPSPDTGKISMAVYHYQEGRAWDRSQHCDYCGRTLLVDTGKALRDDCPCCGAGYPGRVR
jgi:hypothetical protein